MMYELIPLISVIAGGGCILAFVIASRECFQAFCVQTPDMQIIALLTLDAADTCPDP
jgi:hypothetical protein